MGWITKVSLLFAAAVSLAALPDRQAPSDAQRVLGSFPAKQGNPRKLKGRFLHITDFHPDPFYKIGADAEGDHPCHKGKGDKEVGHYGAPTTSCDSPIALVNATFKWIEANIKDEIDFVVWTGDSARHDNDDDYPRSNTQVEDLNRLLVSKFVETFGKTDNIDDPDPTNDFVVPIVPTYGNNDILPHNIFEPGPNRWTKRYLDIWASFVPEAQRHSFARGGWFFTEVIPNKLAVVSLNTLYFFSSNAAVDGCDLESEPGYEHMEWLRIQLQFMRERKMKAILIGHVPPARTESKQSWDETCYQKYTLWQRQYRDVIVANIFGHMNIDHFMFQDVRDLTYKFKIDGVDDEGLRSKANDADAQPKDHFRSTAKAAYINELRDVWSTLPEPPKGYHYAHDDDQSPLRKGRDSLKEHKKFLKDIGGEWAERFSISLVSPSVVPNFFPTLRIIEYNMTGLEHDHPAHGKPQGIPAEGINAGPEPFTESQILMHEDHGILNDILGSEEDTDIDAGRKKKKKHKKKKGKKKKPAKPDFPVPVPPSRASLPGPAFSPQTFSFVSWIQFYANLTAIHKKMESKTEEQNAEGIDDQQTSTAYNEPQWLQSARERAASVKLRNSGHNKHFDFRIEYTTSNDSIYKMQDLTVRSWLELAERIGRTEYKRPSVGQMEAESDLNANEARQSVTRFDDSQDIEVNASQKKGKKHKDSGTGRLKKNRLWHTFVKRVFVQTKSEKDLEDDFD